MEKLVFVLIGLFFVFMVLLMSLKLMRSLSRFLSMLLLLQHIQAP